MNLPPENRLDLALQMKGKYEKKAKRVVKPQQKLSSLAACGILPALGHPAEAFTYTLAPWDCTVEISSV